MSQLSEFSPLSEFSQLSQFVLAGESNLPDTGIPDIGDSRFRLTSASRSRTVRRTWLDTFDWRLFRAGLTLEQVTSGHTAELVLTGRDGELVAAVPTGPDRLRWPGLIDNLPVGPLRERLAPVLDVRALLPVATATSVLTQLRALNIDEKTIAILALDRMTVTRANGAHRTGTARPPEQPPARLAIAPLRGYQAQATRLAEALRHADGVGAATTSPFESALAATGRTPGDYSGKVRVRLDGATPATQSLGVVLSALFGAVEANLPGTIADIDTEFLHDLRVAVRRTRSVLKSGKAVLPASLLAKYRPEFKWLGDLTTPTRDFDVYLLGYPSMAAGLLAASEAELLPLHQFLEHGRASAYRQLVRGLRSARFKSLASDWRGDVEQLASARGRRPATSTFAASRIGKAHRLVLSSGAAIGPDSPPQALHDLRKRCKELRYLLEVFASLYDQSEHWRAVNELKALQDCLGEFQDMDVQIAELRGFATAMLTDRSTPAGTLLAMGEIAAGLAARQAAARQQFTSRFAGFASPRGQARINALTKAAA
jgi:CHAD domain-containing protein